MPLPHIYVVNRDAVPVIDKPALLKLVAHTTVARALHLHMYCHMYTKHLDNCVVHLHVHALKTCIQHALHFIHPVSWVILMRIVGKHKVQLKCLHSKVVSTISRCLDRCLMQCSSTCTGS